VGKRRSTMTTVPAHGDLSPRARIYFFVFVVHTMSTMAGAMQFSRGEREIVLGRTRHTQVVSYTSRRRVWFHEWIHTLEYGPLSLSLIFITRVAPTVSTR
jgi:hypothetical protein